MKINPTIFREYDIRGRIEREDELGDEHVRTIGRAFAVFLKRRGISDAVVGEDARSYSKRIKEITVEALLTSGINVIEIGKVIVPIFYFSQFFFKRKGGVMITASHNPWGWSGFKHAYDYSTTFVPQDMEELRSIIQEGVVLSGSGRREIYADIVAAYKNDVLGRVRLARPLKVLVDTGNGTAGPIVPAILREAGCEVVKQYSEVSEVRHHEANPSNLGMLQAMSEGVKRHSADVGLGFDEDGDRLGAVDERGEIIWSDQILILLARLVLAKNQGAKIVYDVKCTEALGEDIQAQGGVPIMWKTGHSYIKAKAKEEGAALAGEKSGHFFFFDGYYGFDDALFAALKFLEYVSRLSKPVSQIMAELPHYFSSPVWNAVCPDEKKYEVVEKLAEDFKRGYGADKVIDINGARVYLEDGWGLVRASSNIPAIVLVFEAKSEEGLKKIESVFREKLASFPEVGTQWVSG